MQPDPFVVLGLPHTATEPEVKAAYRRLVALYHPDNNPGFQDLATAKVSEINEAYAQVRGGWRPQAGGAGRVGASGAGAGAAAGAVDSAGNAGDRPNGAPGFVRKSRNRSRSGGAPPWTPPPPVRHDNPPRVWDPPTPPPRAKGPQPPPAKYPAPPPPRKGAWEGGGAGAGDAARRSTLIAGLVETGFFASASEAERGHPILDALLPLVAVQARLRSCATYEALEATGDLPSTEHHTHFHHAVPSLALGGLAARTEAIARLEPARFVACTEDQLLWTVSTYAPGEGILLQEDVTVHAAPLTAVAGLTSHPGAIDIALDGGLRLTFHLPKPQAAALAAALVRAG